MSSTKKQAGAKRAELPRGYGLTKSFEKDWIRLTHSGRYDMRRLKEAMMLLVANDGPLPPEFSDHALKGGWDGFRDCHIGGDFLLIYELRDGDRTVIFTRAGTHAELFD
jgi:mRNA interferase YafQ